MGQISKMESTRHLCPQFRHYSRKLGTSIFTGQALTICEEPHHFIGAQKKVAILSLVTKRHTMF